MGRGGFLEVLIFQPEKNQRRARISWALLHYGRVFALSVSALLGVTGCQDDRAVDVEAQPPAVNTPAGDDRPNIIFLLADDQRADSLSSAGHPFSQTPNIDRLAERGTTYTNAFTVAPICAPSRFAFLSGQYERTSGLGFNSPYEVSQAQWEATYPSLLRKAGYFTGFIGKFGVEYYALDGGAASQFDYWGGHDGWLPFFPKELPENPATGIYLRASSDITTEIMGEYIDEFLQTRPASMPFNLSVSFSAPHNSVVSTMHPDAPLEGCETRACELMGHRADENPRLQGHPIYDQLYRNRSISISEDIGGDPFQFIPKGVIDHEARQQWYAYNYDRSTQPEHLIRYHQTVTGIDQVVGDLLERLEALGIADNTVIIYSSDHGLLNGEYSTGGKGLLYDLVTKVPLIVFDPRDDQSGAIDDGLVLSIDVPATILSLAGVQIPAAMEGRDLEAGETRTEIFLESLTVAEGNPFIEALRTQEWKYVRYLEDEGCPYTEDHLDFADRRILFEQLFYLPDDPEERRNLVGDPSSQETLKAYRERLRLMSIERTNQGRLFKKSLPVPFRPAEDIYCW